MTYCNGTEVRYPQPGSRLTKIPEFGRDNILKPIPCTVVYVNKAHGYYTVQFGAGYRQAYKFGG